MKKELYATLAFFSLFAYSSAQTVSLIGQDENTIATYRLDQIKQIVVIPCEAVDLGLYVKWASCNIGANSPEDYGGYYAWGETMEKSEYTFETYRHWVDKNENGQFDWNEGTISTYFAGTENDVAHLNWGGNWRMPHYYEIMDLIDNCTWEWTTVNGVEGQKVTGPNGNSIFLPAAGNRYGTSLDYAGFSGYYWSSSPIGDNSAIALVFYSGGGNTNNFYDWRAHGFSIRPVTD